MAGTSLPTVDQVMQRVMAFSAASQRQVRKIVSGDKERFVDETLDIDLDLKYLTPQIIVMGLPSEGVESIYRNPIDEVARMFETRHGFAHVKIFNLCQERVYDYTKLGNRVVEFRMPDHEVLPLRRINDFCTMAHDFLDFDTDNVVAVHCKGGKGRSGMMLCCLFLHMRLFESANDAMVFFAAQRAMDGKKPVSVTAPCQIRYVGYYASAVGLGIHNGVPSPRCYLTSIAIGAMTIPTRPLVTITANGQEYQFQGPDQVAGESSVVFLNSFCVAGDFRVQISTEAIVNRVLAFFWVHTHFLPERGIELPKQELDEAFKDTTCS
eukprot:c17695_g1_i1.p1 GENE.c17695_g1_i1~~c17695_g1_i1.p1  ORF type:complete len:333 (-),score=77.18 c17695_g1_i1:257-1225(-)